MDIVAAFSDDVSMMASHSGRRAFRVRVVTDPVVVIALVVAALSAVASFGSAVYKHAYVVWALLALVAALVGAVGKAIPTWREERKMQWELEAGVHLDSKGRLPSTTRANLTEVFGVHPSIAPVVPYTERGPETKTLEMLQARRPVLIVGPRLVGKSRLGAEVLRRFNPELPIMSWRDPTTLAAHLDEGLPTGCALWFDDFDRYLAVNAIDAKGLTQLASKNIVVATMNLKAYERMILQDRDTTAAPHTRDLSLRVATSAALRVFAVVDLPNEGTMKLEQLTEQMPSSIRTGIRDTGSIGVYLAGGALAAERVEYLRNYYPLSYGLVRAAVDWSRTQIGDAIPKQAARRLAVAYVAEENLVPAGDVEPHKERAWRAHEKHAASWINGRKSIRLLTPVQDRDRGETWRPFSCLMELLLQDARTAKFLPSIWAEVLNATATGTQGIDASSVAAEVGEVDVAVALLARLLNHGVDADIWALIAGVYYDAGDFRNAETCYRESVAFNHPLAMTSLGLLLRERSPDEARHLFRQAAELGVGDAMSYLGEELEDEDRRAARDWYQKGSDLGSLRSMACLGWVLANRFDDDQGGERWLRKSANTGNPIFMTELGCFLVNHDRMDEAEHWLETPAAAKIPHAMSDLGRALEMREPVRAESLLRAAVELDYLPATVHLGALIEPHDPTEAERWYRRGAERGNVNAMATLANFLRLRDPKEAEKWYRDAKMRGSESASVGLDKLLADASYVNPTPVIDS